MTVDEAVEKILALREVTRATGCITRRSQSEVLASIPNDMLVEVAVRPRRITEGNRHEDATK